MGEGYGEMVLIQGLTAVAGLLFVRILSFWIGVTMMIREHRQGPSQNPSILGHCIHRRRRLRG